MSAPAVVVPRRELTHEYSGAAWLEAGYKVKCSPVGWIAAEILGFVYRGLYHLPEASLAKPDWTNEHWVAVNVPDGLATYDGSALTELVLLAHDLGVRLEIQQGGPGRLKLYFHARERRTGGTGVWSRHPTLEEAAERLRARYTAVFEPADDSQLEGA